MNSLQVCKVLGSFDKQILSGLCLLLAVSSPPDFDTNNLIEKSGRGTGGKNQREKRRSIYFSRLRPSEKVEEESREKTTSHLSGEISRQIQ